MKKVNAFAHFGTEKMIYDIRMGPQCIYHNGIIYVVYSANEEGVPGRPHIITYDKAIKKWSDPVRLGMSTLNHMTGNPFPDHHFAPILWFDKDFYIHVLYRCHIFDGGIHMISARPECIDEWRTGPEISHSISYPRIIKLNDGRLLLYYRLFGHMGYWAYQISTDGGYTWSSPEGIVDFDQNPVNDIDTWAGSYHSVLLDRDGKTLHIGFVYWDERKAYNTLYKKRLNSINRYHLYYCTLNISTGRLCNIYGDALKLPVSRLEAEKCKIWDTGLRLTNMPSMAIDDNNNPCFLLPVSENTPWECGFYFVKKEKGEWKKIRIAGTNSTWSGCQLIKEDNGDLTAYLVCGNTDGTLLPYGGGKTAGMGFK